MKYSTGTRIILLIAVLRGPASFAAFQDRPGVAPDKVAASEAQDELDSPAGIQQKPVAPPAEEDRAAQLKALSELISVVVKAAFGDEEPARAGRQVVQDAAVFAMPNNPPPAESIQEARLARMRAHATVMQNWLVETMKLTPADAEGVRRVLNSAVMMSAKEFAKPGQSERNAYLSDFAPVTFTDQYGAALQIINESRITEIQELLNADSAQKLNDALRERREFFRDCFLADVMSTIHDELFLTSDQRRKLARELRRSLEDLDSGLFAFNPQTYYINRRSLNNAFTDQAKAMLTAEQRTRLSNITSGDRSAIRRYISFASNNGTHTWFTKLENSVDEQRIWLAEAAAVRVSYYAVECGLESSAKRYLTLAAKGAGKKCVADWFRKSKEQLQQWEERIPQMRGNFSFSIQSVQADSLDRHVIWKHALETVGANPSELDARLQDERRVARVDSILAFVDKEIWLRPDQREPMRQLLHSHVPRSSTTSFEYLRELLFLAVPVTQIDEAQLVTFLDVQQVEAWLELKRQFKSDGRMIRVAARHGDLSLVLPK